MQLSLTWMEKWSWKGSDTPNWNIAVENQNMKLRIRRERQELGVVVSIPTATENIRVLLYRLVISKASEKGGTPSFQPQGGITPGFLASTGESYWCMYYVIFLRWKGGSNDINFSLPYLNKLLKNWYFLKDFLRLCTFNWIEVAGHQDAKLKLRYLVSIHTLKQI